MSAICAVHHPDGKPADPLALTRVMDALAVYGPDGASTWREGPIVLGHQRLHVTPESLREQLPFYDPDARLAITADARLDNREELFAALDVPHPKRAGMPDSQLIVLAYRRWDTDCARHLLGDFAFAIWDDRRRRLFCARDILGVRPFYYHLASDRFLLASDMSGILAAPRVPDEPDMEYLSAHFLGGCNYPHATRTFYAGIRKLARAHSMTIDRDGMKTWAYWEADRLPEVRLKTDDDYAAALRDLLDKSVRARLRSAFPVGAHLSGGLDSSSLAVIAARALRERGERLTGYSWAPPPETDEEASSDERCLVEQLRHLEDIPVHYSNVTAADVVDLHFRSPGVNHDAGFVHELAVRRQARSRGVRVMLSGWGGDELITFNGRGFFADLFRRGKWWKMWREMRMRTAIHGGSTWKQLVFKAVFPLLPDWVLKRLYEKALPAFWDETSLPSMFSPHFNARLRAAVPLPHKRGRERAGVRAQQLGLLAHGHLTHRIEGWASGGGRAGLNYAYPLLDRRIVEFSLGLPPEMFFKNGWKRYLFRHALRGILLDEVRWNKTKQEPALNDDRRRINDMRRDVMMPFVAELLATPRPYRYLDGDRARRAVRARLDGQEGGNAMREVFVELLVNQGLAAEVQRQVDELRRGQSKSSPRKAA